MIPAWSHSRLDTFKSCPRQYEAKYVSKSVSDPPGEAQLYGTKVHLDFEKNQRDGAPLPEYLKHHQPFMDEIRQGRLIGVERKVALTNKLRAVEVNEWFKPLVPLPAGEFVWWRGVIDHDSELRTDGGRRRARCVDYKTGKQHTKMEQLKEYAIFKFCEGFDEVEVMYYWTQTRQALPRMIFPKEQMGRLLESFVPDLMQYKEAYATNIWQPRPNGLCRRHCPVFDCEHNQRSGPNG